MALPPSYYADSAADYRERRDLLCGVLDEAGFTFRVPDGAYYVLCTTGDLDPAQDSSAYARRIVQDPGIYLSDATIAKASLAMPRSADIARMQNRLWLQLKSGG